MTAQTERSSPGLDYAQVISAAGQGAGRGFESTAQNAATKREAKEAKRRTLANLLNQTIKRNQNIFKMKQQHGDEMRDFQSQALQQVARGFVDAMKS